VGIKRVDFGQDVEVGTGGKIKALQTSPSAGWLAEVLDVKYVTSKSSDNVGIEVTYKVTDEEAVDVDGNAFAGKKQWDKIWFSGKSLKMTKIKLRGLGVDVENLIIESETDVQDLAEQLRDEARGLEVALVTEAKEDEYKNNRRKSDDDETYYKSEVKFVNEVS
jgi:hypothetical protein